jgi:hypothetical protein
VSERLSDIEQKIRSSDVEKSLRENLKRLESQLQQSVDRKMQSLHAEIHAVTELSNRLEGNSLSWFWPFLVVIFVQICAAFGAYTFYKNLRKKHFL